MKHSEVEKVLANWIAQANSSQGQLQDDIDPTEWVAAQFVKWWHPMINDTLSDADGAALRLREELNRLGGWENRDLGEALHELTHVNDALSALRAALGLNVDESDM